MLECTKFDFGWGSAPDPAVRAHSAPRDPLAAFEWSYFWDKKKEGKKKEETRRKEKATGKEKEKIVGKETKARKGEKVNPLSKTFGYGLA